MGLFDSASNAIKGAAAGTGRATKTFQLKGQLNDIAKQRTTLAAQLGASLFDETRNKPEFRTSREELFSAIEALDAQRNAIQAEITQIEQEGQAAQQAAVVYTCPKCGSKVGATDSFCVGCGTPIAEIKKDLNLCPQCGTPLEEGAAFCVGCGCAITTSESQQVSADQTTVLSGTHACPQCGTILSSDTAFCVGCGRPVKEQEKAVTNIDVAAEETVPTLEQVDAGILSDEALVPVAPDEFNTPGDEKQSDENKEAAQEPTASSSDIPGLCPKCGYENIDTAKFCFNCGNALK